MTKRFTEMRFNSRNNEQINSIISWLLVYGIFHRPLRSTSVLLSLHIEFSLGPCDFTSHPEAEPCALHRKQTHLLPFPSGSCDTNHVGFSLFSLQQPSTHPSQAFYTAITSAWNDLPPNTPNAHYLIHPGVRSYTTWSENSFLTPYPK